MMGPKTRVNDEIVTKHKVVSRCTYNSKKRKTSIPFLPDEIIFHILVWLPADILYNTMRYVCKQWYAIIKDPRFVGEQILVCSTMGICFQCTRESVVYFAQFGKKKATLSKLLTLPSHVRVTLPTTCNGLILFRDESLMGRVHVANPLTKQMFTLPVLDSVSNTSVTNLCKFGILTSPRYSIGCTRNSPLEFKVVFNCQCEFGSVRYGVFTLGKDDNWRITDSKSLYSRDENRLLCNRRPRSAGKFLHWVYSDIDYIATMDMESEKIYFSPAPKLTINIGTSVSVYYVIRGDSLTCMIGLYDTMLWEVWVLLEDIVNGAWNKICDIDFRPQNLRRTIKNLFRKYPQFDVKIVPVAWIENGEVVVFKPQNLHHPFIAYNVKTGYAFQFRGHDDHVCDGLYSSYAPSLLSLN